MYIPSHFKETNETKLLDFIAANNFGVLVTKGDEAPVATHIPFILEKRGEKAVLISHMALANAQWKEFLENKQVLVIFNGPHAYVSPAMYEEKQSVPTWNFVAVHAYGALNMLEGDENKMTVLTKMILSYDAAYKAQFDALDKRYTGGLLKGIVAFEIEIARLEGKYKLSQNRSHAERENIIAAFSASDDAMQKGIAREMGNKS